MSKQALDIATSLSLLREAHNLTRMLYQYSMQQRYLLLSCVSCGSYVRLIKAASELFGPSSLSFEVSP